MKDHIKKMPFVKRKPSKKLVIIILSSIVVILVTSWIGYSWWRSFTVNYAQEIAKPLEQSLVKAGAIKACSYGDSGRGPDNQAPWQVGYYSVALDHDKTEQLIKNASKENGYNLVNVSQDDSPDLRATGMEYFDAASKEVPYKDLKSGKVYLAFSIINDGSFKLDNFYCDANISSVVKSDANNSIIYMDLRLTDYK